MNDFYQIIGRLILEGGGAVVIAYGVIHFAGKKWIDSFFVKKHDKFKQQLDEEMEKFKHQMGIELLKMEQEAKSFYNRISKVHEKEFKVIPDIWKKLCDAKSSASEFASMISLEPDLDRMSAPALSSYLDKTSLEQYQKDEIIASEKKLETYRQKMFFIRLHAAKMAFIEFHEYVLKNRLFLSKELQQKINEADDLIWGAIIDKEMGKHLKDYALAKSAYIALDKNLGPIVDKIEEIAQERLRVLEA